MKKLLLIITATLCFTSCNFNSIRGDRNVVSKEFEVSDYSKIHLATSGNVIYTQNENLPSRLHMEIDSNLVDFIDVKNQDGYLCIFNKEGVNLRPSKFIIYANSKTIEGIKLSGAGKFEAKELLTAQKMNITLSGAGNIQLKKLIAESTDIRLSGAGDINLEGKTTYASMRLSGAGNLNAPLFITKNLNSQLSGVGSISIHVTDSLTASLSGVGSVEYSGNPSYISNRSSGVGSIKAVKE